MLKFLLDIEIPEAVKIKKNDSGQMKYYLTNLDFPEIARGFPFQNATFWGKFQV